MVKVRLREAEWPEVLQRGAAAQQPGLRPPDSLLSALLTPGAYGAASLRMGKGRNRHSGLG